MCSQIYHLPAGYAISTSHYTCSKINVTELQEPTKDGAAIGIEYSAATITEKRQETVLTVKQLNWLLLSSSLFFGNVTVLYVVFVVGLRKRYVVIAVIACSVIAERFFVVCCMQ